MAEGLRRTLSQATVYGFGTVVSNAASLVMLPIYTHYLTPQDYGLLEMLQMLADVTAIIFGMRITAGVLRIYFDSDDENTRRKVMSTAWITDLALHLVGVFALITFAVPASRIFLGSESYAHLVALFACSLATLVMIAIPMAYLRALQRPWAFISVSISKLLVQVGLNIFFVVHKGMGPYGVVISTLITTGVFGLGLSIWHFKRAGFRLDLSVSKRMLNFGVPLALASVGAFYTTYGDRFFIQHFWTLAEVGLYALAYRFSFALYTLTYGTFEQAWSAQSYLIYKQDNRHEIFSRVFLLIICGMIFAGTALSVFAYDIIRIMSNDSFRRAWICIPALAGAYIVHAASDFCGFGIRLHEKTREFLWASLISVAVMTVFYVLLIPRYGSFGAAIATLIGMCSEFWWIRRRADRLEHIPLPWFRVIAMTVACVAVFCISLRLPNDNLLLSLLTRGLLLTVTAVCIFFSPIIGREERKAGFALLHDGARKFGLVSG